VEGWHLRK